MTNDKKVKYFNKDSNFELINNNILIDGSLTFKFPPENEIVTFTAAYGQWSSCIDKFLFEAEYNNLELNTFTFRSGTKLDILKILCPLFSNGNNPPLEKKILKAKVLGAEVIELIPQTSEPQGYVYLIKLGKQYELISPWGFGCIPKTLLYRLACIAQKIVITGDVPICFEKNPFALANIEIDSPYFINQYEYDSKATLGLRHRYPEESYFEENYSGFGGFYTRENKIIKADYDFKENPVLLTNGDLSPKQTETITGKDVLIKPNIFNKRADHFENLKKIDVENLVLILDKRIKIPKGCTAKKFKSICMKECFRYSKQLDKSNIQLKVLKSFPYVDLNLFYKHDDIDDWCIPIEALTEEQIESARILIRKCGIQGTPHHGRISAITITTKNSSNGRKSKHNLEITGIGQCWLLPDGRVVFDMSKDSPLSHIRFKNFKKPKHLVKK